MPHAHTLGTKDWDTSGPLPIRREKIRRSPNGPRDAVPAYLRRDDRVPPTAVAYRGERERLKKALASLRPADRVAHAVVEDEGSA